MAIETNEIPLGLAIGAVREAEFYINQAIWQLGYASDNFGEARMANKKLAARNAKKQLEAFQTEIIENRLIAQAGL